MTESDERQQEQDRPVDGAGNENEVPQTSRPDTTPDGHLHYHPDEAAEYGEKPDEIPQSDGDPMAEDNPEKDWKD